jgi:hypothetical protein
LRVGVALAVAAADVVGRKDADTMPDTEGAREGVPLVDTAGCGDADTMPDTDGKREAVPLADKEECDEADTMPDTDGKAVPVADEEAVPVVDDEEVAVADGEPLAVCDGEAVPVVDDEEVAVADGEPSTAPVIEGVMARHASASSNDARVAAWRAMTGSLRCVRTWMKRSEVREDGIGLRLASAAEMGGGARRRWPL